MKFNSLKDTVTTSVAVTVLLGIILGVTATAMDIWSLPGKFESMSSHIVTIEDYIGTIEDKVDNNTTHLKIIECLLMNGEDRLQCELEAIKLSQ